MNMNSLPDDPSFDRRLTVLETRFDTILPTLATKRDIEDLRTEFSTGLERLRGEFRSELEKLRGEFRSELEKLRAEMFRALHDAMKWMVGIVVTIFIGLLGANFAMFNAMKSLIESSRPPAPAIEVPAAHDATVPRNPPVIKQR
jgi:hypothetical protein